MLVERMKKAMKKGMFIPREETIWRSFVVGARFLRSKDLNGGFSHG